RRKPQTAYRGGSTTLTTPGRRRVFPGRAGPTEDRRSCRKKAGSQRCDSAESRRPQGVRHPVRAARRSGQERLPVIQLLIGETGILPRDDLREIQILDCVVGEERALPAVESLRGEHV